MEIVRERSQKINITPQTHHHDQRLGGDHFKKTIKSSTARPNNRNRTP